MKSKSYLCMICKSKFSRKWNAFRHNIAVHSNLAKIVSYSNSSANSSRPTNLPKDIKNFNKNKYHKFEYLQTKFGPPRDDDYMDFLLEDENNTDSKIMKIIGQMIKPYRELESLLDYMDPQNKALVLDNTFTLALLSYNPVKSFSETADFYRSNIGLKEIAKHSSVARNISIHEAMEFVKESVRSSTLIRRMNN